MMGRVGHPARRCYVHVGTPKSGTSYLQSIVWASRDRLAEQGLELLLDGEPDQFYVSLALRGLLDERFDPPRAHTALERLKEQLSRVEAPRALFTHEWLAPCTPEETRRFRAMLAGFDVHVVVTARDLARQIPSHWQQSVQQRGQQTYSDFVDSVVRRDPSADDFWLNHDVADVAARWRADLPVDRVHVVTVPSAGAEQGLLLRRFCSLLQVDPSSMATDAAQSNPALGLVQAELLRRVTLALGDRLPHPRAGFGRLGKRFLGGQILTTQNGVPPRLPASLLDWCRDVSWDTVQKLREEGYDVVGDLDELVPVPSDDSIGEMEVTDADLAAAAVEAIAAMLDQRNRDLKRIESLRETAQEHEHRGSPPRSNVLRRSRDWLARARAGQRS